MNRRNLWIIGLVVTIVLIVVYFYAGDNVETDNETIKVGVITPLTGFTQESGQNVKKGLELGKEKLAEEGIKIDLIYQDDECSPTKAVSAYNSLILDPDVKIITGFVCSGSILPLAPLVEGTDVYLLGTTTSSPLVSNAGENIYRVAPNDKEDALIQYSFISSRFDKGTKVGVVYINNDYGVALKDVLIKELGDNGYTVIQDSFNFGTSDFKTILSKLKSQNVDVISFVGYPENSPIFLKQKKELSINAPVIGSWGTLSGEFFNPKNSDLLKEYYVVFFGRDNLVGSEFYESYKTKYNEEPVFYADFGYDSILVIGEIIKDKGKVYKNSLQNVEIENGSTGPISFDENGDRIGIVTKLFKFEEGKLVCEFNC